MRRTWVKSIFAVLCVLLLNVGVWGCVVFGIWEYNIAENREFYDGVIYWETVEDYVDMAEEAFHLHVKAEQGELSNYDRTRLEMLEENYLKVGNTNFRFVVYQADTNELRYGNAGANWKAEVYEVHSYSYLQYWEYNGVDAQSSWVNGVMEYGVTWPLAAQDDLLEGEKLHRTVDQYMPLLLAVSISCVVISLILLIMLMRAAGRRADREDVVLNWHDKIPYDLYLVIQICLIAFCIFSIGESATYLEWYPHWANLLWMVGSALVGSIFVIVFLLTTATRIKARTIFRNTIIWRVCSLIWRGCKAVVRGVRNAINVLPLVGRIAALAAIYLAGALITTILFIVGVVWFHYDGWAVCLTLLMILAIPAWHGFAIFLVCRWAMQWKQMRAVTQEIISGKTDVKIESETFYPDLKEHAEQLNALGNSIDHAVEERMKSERFKSELITNVSHDLKTPLTSIINYVDLLKKEDIPNPTAREYIEVLDRKSQRLKKLTEDLVEASKASTGALTVNRERLDVVQLIRQAAGEYEEKLAGASLVPVVTLPDAPVYVKADGRHLWRILDNLLSNCAKYAMEGTRVYVDLNTVDGKALITVKSISRHPLNVPAEQLTERFVRGDESRTTEGSGLGLSIARSLAQLQKGTFWLDIDGDLFKANVAFPLDETV